MNPYHVSPQDADAFDQLLESVELKQPYGGYASEADLPRLSERDLAIVMRAKPGLLDDFVVDTHDVANILDCTDTLGGMTLAEMLHLRLMTYAKRAAQREVFEALQERSEPDEFDRLMDKADAQNDMEAAS